MERNNIKQSHAERAQTGVDARRGNAASKSERSRVERIQQLDREAAAVADSDHALAEKLRRAAWRHRWSLRAARIGERGAKHAQR